MKFTAAQWQLSPQSPEAQPCNEVGHECLLVCQLASETQPPNLHTHIPRYMPNFST
jgi:hypothetical protein